MYRIMGKMLIYLFLFFLTLIFTFLFFFLMLVSYVLFSIILILQQSLAMYSILLLYIKLNKNTDVTPTINILPIKIITNGFLYIFESRAISGTLMPVPHINKLITAPRLMPFMFSVLPIISIVSSQTYNGIPIKPAIEIGINLSSPATLDINSVGINS